MGSTRGGRYLGRGTDNQFSPSERKIYLRAACYGRRTMCDISIDFVAVAGELIFEAIFRGDFPPFSYF